MKTISGDKMKAGFACGVGGAATTWKGAGFCLVAQWSNDLGPGRPVS